MRPTAWLVAFAAILIVLAVAAAAPPAKEGYLIDPYLDLDDSGAYWGSHYALMEQPPTMANFAQSGPKQWTGENGPTGNLSGWRNGDMVRKARPSVDHFKPCAYDMPYEYPSYIARATTAWDDTARCSANCSHLPCAVWCR